MSSYLYYFLTFVLFLLFFFFFFFKRKPAYEMRINDWSSDVCSSDLRRHRLPCCAPSPSMKPWSEGVGDGGNRSGSAGSDVGPAEALGDPGPARHAARRGGALEDDPARSAGVLRLPRDRAARRAPYLHGEQARPVPVRTRDRRLRVRRAAFARPWPDPEIGRGHVCTTVNNAH